MMYDSFRNLGKNTLRTALLCLGILLLSNVPSALANAPVTGMEGGQRHSYGPNVDGEGNDRMITGTTIVDAYGNVVTPMEEDTTPRKRLRKGAYGGANQSGSSRPLPDPPGTDAGWNFN